MEKNMYYAPVPNLQNQTPVKYVQVQYAKQPLLKPVVHDQEAAPVQKNSFTQEQIASIQKSLADKKDQADHEVKKAVGVFSKINRFYHIFAKVKTVVMMLFSVYHMAGGNYESSILPLMLSMIMSIILFKKTKTTKKAIKKNDHKTVKKAFMKSLVLAGIFLGVFLLWSSSILKTQKVEVTNIDQKIIKKSLVDTQAPIQLNIEKLKHVRIGSPGARFGNKFDKIPKKTPEPKKPAVESPLKKFTVEHPIELPSLQSVLVVLFIFVLFKFGYYFTHFHAYKSSLEKQEKLNMMIAHFESLPCSEETRDEIQVEKENYPVIEEVKEQYPVVEKKEQYPVIEEEEVPLERYVQVSERSVEDNRIIDIREEPQYPIPAPPAKFPGYF